MMIEKVARALCRRSMELVNATKETPRSEAEIAAEVDGAWRLHTDYARAAIEAMREPLAEALEPFADVADWADRNGYDLKRDFDMLLRGPANQIAGHLGAVSDDFIRARDTLAMITAALADHG